METKNNSFKYLDEIPWQEREAIANELKGMYNGMLDDENNHYALLLERKSKGGYDKLTQEYIISSHKLSVIQGVLDLLHIDYEYGKKLDLPEEMAVPLF